MDLMEKDFIKQWRPRWNSSSLMIHGMRFQDPKLRKRDLEYCRRLGRSSGSDTLTDWYENSRHAGVFEVINSAKAWNTIEKASVTGRTSADVSRQPVV